MCQKQCPKNSFQLITNSEILCLPNCPSGYYRTQQKDTNKCVACFDNCLTCSGPLHTDCIQCKKDYILHLHSFQHICSE